MLAEASGQIEACYIVAIPLCQSTCYFEQLNVKMDFKTARGTTESCWTWQLYNVCN